MILTEPTDFEIVEKLLLDKTVVTTPLKSWQIARLRDQFDIRGMFSAQTMSGQLLSGYLDQLKQMGGGQMDVATARWHIKDLIDELNIKPPSEEEAGTITDLGSNRRIELVLKTNLEMARGFGQYTEGMTEGALIAFPAMELIRVEARAVPREWFDIWDDAADELGDETTATDADDTGRMVAKKGDPIWLAISDFGQPWPPFKYNSGMGVEDVDRDEAIELDVVDEDELPPNPKEIGFNEGVQSSVLDLAPALLPVIAAGLSGIATQVGHFFRLLPPPPPPKKEDREESGRVTAANAREHGEEVLFLLDNMGTHQGGIEGWITRRSGQPLSARRSEKIRVRRQIKQGRQALRQALNSHKDQNDAMQVPGAGSIDFDHGRPGNPKSTKDDGYGISHIEAKHPDEMNQLPRTLAKGQVYPHESDSKKLYVVHGNNVAVLRQKERGNGSWSQSRFGVVTHFRDVEKARALAGTSLSNSSQVLLEEFLSLEGYASRPTFNADREGCWQDPEPTTPAVLRQRTAQALQILEEAA